MSFIEDLAVNKIRSGRGLGELLAQRSSIPADGSAGYAPGCELILTSAMVAGSGKATRFINTGSRSSSKFRAIGPRGGPSIYKCVQATSAGGDTTEEITIQGIQATTDISLVGHIVSDDNDQIAAQVVTRNTVTITTDIDPSTVHQYVVPIIRSGVVPEWDIFAAGTHTTVGGAAAEAITVTGALATDLAMATYSATNDTDLISKVE